jgi:ketosteroid isomerase-like protein
VSQQNLDLVVRATRAVMEHPTPDYATMNELYAPDHMFVPAGAESGLEQPQEGAEGFRAWQRGLDETMTDLEHELHGAVDIGPDRVLTVTTTRAKGKTSGVATELRLWQLVTVAGGKIVRTDVYTDARDAIEAARSS